jgi:hypothetical protein
MSQRTIAITFAGRQDRMRLLCAYMHRALDACIDEWHIWNYARTKEDKVWVQSLASGNTVKVFTPETTHAEKRFEAVYKHYAPDAQYAPDTVFVKLDDDIVFVDLDGLAKLVHFRRANPHYYIVSANVVNNPLCYVLQKQFAGVGQELVKKEPAGVGNALTAFIWSGKVATALHYTFLEHGPAAFEFPSIIEYALDKGPNINCIAWLGADLNSVTHCESTQLGNDETYLAMNFPRIFERPACVFGPCVVSHLSFGTQDPDMPVPALLEVYECLAEQLKDRQGPGFKAQEAQEVLPAPEAQSVLPAPSVPSAQSALPVPGSN